MTSLYWDDFTTLKTGDVEETAWQRARGMSAEQIVEAVEALEDDAKDAAERIEKAKVARRAMLRRLAGKLGDGEVVEAPSGRIAYRTMVPAGRRSVREDAVREHADELPENLHIRTIEKPPTIAAIEQAVEEGRISKEIAAALIDVPERVPGIRWRTIPEDDPATDWARAYSKYDHKQGPGGPE